MAISRSRGMENFNKLPTYLQEHVRAITTKVNGRTKELEEIKRIENEYAVEMFAKKMLRSK
jgi:peptide subunit release factor RF-3